MPATGTTYKTLVDELSRVIGDHGIATALIDEAGFTPALRPHASTPLGFWSTVVRKARNGAGHDGVLAISRGACALYQSNSKFAACLDALQSGTELWMLSLSSHGTPKHSQDALIAAIGALNDGEAPRLHYSSFDGTCLVLELTGIAAAGLRTKHTTGELSVQLNVPCRDFKICDDHRLLLPNPIPEEPKGTGTLDSHEEPNALAIKGERRPHQQDGRSLAAVDDHHAQILRDPRAVARVLQFALGYPLSLAMVIVAALVGLIDTVPLAAISCILLGTMSGALLATSSPQWWTTLENERCKAIRIRYGHAREALEKYRELFRAMGISNEEIDAMLSDRVKSLLAREQEELTGASPPDDPP